MDLGANGFQGKNAAIDVARFANVLKFSAEVEGSWGSKAPADRYYDASYHKRALAMVMLNDSEVTELFRSMLWFRMTVPLVPCPL